MTKNTGWLFQYETRPVKTGLVTEVQDCFSSSQNSSKRMLKDTTNNEMEKVPIFANAHIFNQYIFVMYGLIKNGQL